ncbi:ABC transporter permease [Actinophytocola oryzae]|uniref:Peptide/nickel transport system permease protein n=1 Tax=Actinophytocola oryzae TaxID=502181 RepID=A0A4R7W7X5_9PSEU|nr:ABC transporter permease [Actinophytocola oryzae]TDV57777.1 peptide/nickel transport system permease protein [Actinophytocola oryzae]
MGAYLVRRLATNVLVFLLITVAIFWLVHKAPGDPIAMRIPADQLNSGSTEYIAQQRHALGLDRPVFVQYWFWLTSAVQGDLGYSLLNGRPVTELLGERIGPTVELMLIGLVISLLIAFPLGILAARRKNSVWDYGTAVVSLGSVSIPVFFLALIAIFVFTLQWQWLPSSGIADPANPSLLDSIRHLVLPALILGIANTGSYLRYIRGTMITELGADYVRTAEAKGASRRRVVYRHALRNSLIPVITVIASNMGQLLAGAVVIEQVFAWPGMGQLAISSVRQQDYSVIVGFALLVAILVLLFNLLADVLYTVVDPRVRLR